METGYRSNIPEPRPEILRTAPEVNSLRDNAERLKVRRVGPLQLLIYSKEISKVLSCQLPHIMVPMEMGIRIRGCDTDMNEQNNNSNFHRVTENVSARSFFHSVSEGK